MQKRIRKIDQSEKLFAGEFNQFKRLITEVYPDGIVSIVSDSFDYWSVITKMLPALKNVIMSRNGKVVIRPDSGDPVKIIVGDPDSYVPHVRKGTIECMWETFGGVITEKGYKQLDSHIGLIYGDSITLDRQKAILHGLERKGFSSNNVVLGIGSYTYQCVTRDNFGFAMKATYGEINGVPRDIYKDPKTDNGTKKSAKGLLGVVRDKDGNLQLLQGLTKQDLDSTLLQVVFEDGLLIRETSLNEIRSILND